MFAFGLVVDVVRMLHECFHRVFDCFFFRFRWKTFTGVYGKKNVTPSPTPPFHPWKSPASRRRDLKRYWRFPMCRLATAAVDVVPREHGTGLHAQPGDRRVPEKEQQPSGGRDRQPSAVDQLDPVASDNEPAAPNNGHGPSDVSGEQQYRDVHVRRVFPSVRHCRERKLTAARHHRTHVHPPEP